KKKIRDRVSVEKLHAACAPCSWLRSGMCEKALLKLKSVSALLLLFAGIATVDLPSARAADPVAAITTRQSALRSKIVGKTKAPKAAKALAKASDFLDAEKYAEAVSSAKSAEGNGDFADHALAIRGLAE